MCEQAFSSDGYLIDQSKTGMLPYGNYDSSYNGCGWIAAYNALKAAGRTIPYETIRQELQRSLMLGGLLGTNMFYLCWYLGRKGFHLRKAFTLAGAQMVSRGAVAGIVTYWTGRGIHFAAFTQEQGEVLRFFNAVMGKERHHATMEQFFRELVRFPLTFVMALEPLPRSRARTARRRLGRG